MRNGSATYQQHPAQRNPVYGASRVQAGGAYSPGVRGGQGMACAAAPMCGRSIPVLEHGTPREAVNEPSGNSNGHRQALGAGSGVAGSGVEMAWAVGALVAWLWLSYSESPALQFVTNLAAGLLGVLVLRYA